MTFSLILTFSAFLLSLLGTRLYILTFRKRAFPLDPNQPRQKRLPHNGGIVVVMAMIICLLTADMPYGIALALFLIAAISLLEEVTHIPQAIKLLVYLMAVLIPVGLAQNPVFGGWLPVGLDKALTVILWIWFIHACNVMDGVDGITPITMLSIGMGLVSVSILAGNFPEMLSTYSLIVAAAGWGFLWWNWYPAKVLLGEVGSAPIGFFLGYLLFTAALSGYPYAACIMPAYYVSDVLMTQARQLYQNKKPFTPHNDYIYLNAVRKGRKHDAVVRYIFGINMLLILLATYSVIEKALAPFFVLMAYFCAFMLLAFFAYQKPNAQEPF